MRIVQLEEAISKLRGKTKGRLRIIACKNLREALRETYRNLSILLEIKITNGMQT